MKTLTSGRVAQLLEKLHQNAEAAGSGMMKDVVARMEASGAT